MIPWQIKDALRAVLDMRKRRRSTAGYSSLHKTPGQNPVLGFGGILDAAELIHGGAVKLLSLREAFACDERGFNILYLVSSAQPAFAEDLVRICLSRGIKFVWNQNGVGYPGWAGSEAGRHNAPMRRLRRLADFVVYQSEFCRESAEEFLGPCATPSKVLLNPVDLAEFSPRQEPLSPLPLRLLAAGTHTYRERVLSALECVRHLRDGGLECELTVAGPLTWKHAAQEIHAAVASMGLSSSVEIVPGFARDEAPGIYRANHILVHPKYMDPCPTVVAEALACGLPVVASRSGGVPEMVDNDCAKLVEVPLSWRRLHTTTGQELAGAVRAISEDLPGFARAARRRAELAFDARAWCAMHAAIFRSLSAI
jgi:glycosyltransferase involved in cell wall biosynthesis